MSIILSNLSDDPEYAKKLLGEEVEDREMMRQIRWIVGMLNLINAENPVITE